MMFAPQVDVQINNRIVTYIIHQMRQDERKNMAFFCCFFGLQTKKPILQQKGYSSRSPSARISAWAAASRATGTCRAWQEM